MLNTKSNSSEISLLKDSDWSIIDSEPCRVINFTPMGSVKDGKVIAIDKSTPYASITFECKKLPDRIKGFICHKMDFEHLWAAFKKRGVKNNEEVIIFYSKKHFRSYAKIFSAFMPRLWVMICHKGAFELMTDPNHKPEIKGEARYKMEKPIIDWKPEVME